MQTKDGSPTLPWRSSLGGSDFMRQECPWPGASFQPRGVWTTETMWLQESQDVGVPSDVQDSQNFTYQYLL